jgi:hypothetical protein
MIYEPFDSSLGALKSLCLSNSIIKGSEEGETMGNRALVLMNDGKWIELINCIIIGAVEYPDKVVYHKYLFSDCEIETRREMINRAGKYVTEIKNILP